MSDEGKQVKARRERLGMSIQELAKEAGVSRDTLSDLESGTKDFRRLTLNKIQRALDRIEEEAGIGAPGAAPEPSEAETFEFSLTDADGLRIVAKGPKGSADELRRQAVEMFREARSKREQSSDG